MSYRIIVNQNFEFELNSEHLNQMDFFHLSEENLQLRKKGKNFTGRVIQSKTSPKALTIFLNGNTYNVLINDKLDRLVDKLGLSIFEENHAGDLLSPMPGLVLDILVKEGDTIKSGQELLILEAMKMENVIKANGEGVIDSIQISKGDKVEKSQILIKINPI